MTRLPEGARRQRRVSDGFVPPPPRDKPYFVYGEPWLGRKNRRAAWDAQSRQIALDWYGTDATDALVEAYVTANQL